MKRIGILGDIGSGKTYVANNFGYPVFNADFEVSKIYKKDRKTFKKLNQKIPKFIHSFPINKTEITRAVLSNHSNFQKIITIIHSEVRKRLRLFLQKNKKKHIIVLDIPLLLENKINTKKDILVFIDSEKKEVKKRLKKRKNYNLTLLNKFRKIQLPSSYKKRKANFIIKNDFRRKTVKSDIKNILNKLKK